MKQTSSKLRMLPYTSIEEVEDPEPGTVVRDEHGIAVLDPKVWVLDVRHEVFVNRTTLETMQWPDVLNDEYARARQDPCVKHMMLARKQASAFALSAATVVTPKGPNPVPHPELPKVLPDIGPLDLFGSPSLGGHGVYQFAVPEPTPSFWSALAYAAEDEARRTNDADFNVMGAHSEAADNVGASLARRVGEVLKALHPGVEGVRCSNAFVVNYHAGRADVPDYHQAHADRSDLTLNLCLGHNFKGGDLIFSEPPVPGAGPERKDNVPQPSAMVSKVDRLASAGGFASRVLGQPTKFHASDNDAKKRTGSVRVPHAVGHAVLHMGSLTHETASVVEGQRVNLICFLSVDMVPFPFVELPKDIQRFILLFLTPGEMTALAGTCRAVRTVISAHDAVWMDHFWRMFTTTSLVKEAEQLRSEGVSAKAVFMAAKELQCIGELASTIKSAVPKIMMKAMYDPDKESKELDKWKWSVREMGLQTEAVAIRRQKVRFDCRMFGCTFYRSCFAGTAVSHDEQLALYSSRLFARRRLVAMDGARREPNPDGASNGQND